MSLFIVGPTASGKSSLGVNLCQRFDLDFVNVDSMQVYRGLDVSVAKPSVSEQAVVRHHLIDLVDPSDEYDAFYFKRDHDALSVPVDRRVYVGGTGLYHKVVLDDYEFPGFFPEVRAELASVSTEVLFERLKVLDPVAADKSQANNRRRIFRALEVTIGSGVPFSEQGPGIGFYPDTDHVVVGLRWDLSLLDVRINRRVDLMVEQGLLDEVRFVVENFDVSKSCSQALGLKEFVPWVRGDASVSECSDLLKQRTRRFARRQMSWFRRDPRICWFDVDEGVDVSGQVAEFAGL